MNDNLYGDAWKHTNEVSLSTKPQLCNLKEINFTDAERAAANLTDQFVKHGTFDSEKQWGHAVKAESPTPVHKKESDIMTSLSLANLSHATLVDHATKLQADHDALKAELDEARTDLEALETVEVDLEDTEIELDRAINALSDVENQLRIQTKLKNDHIDKHVESARRANEADQQIKTLDDAVTNLSGLLRDTVEESDGLAYKLDMTQSQVDILRRKNRRLKSQLEPGKLKQESKEKISLASFRYTTIQTVVRWAATAGTLSWIFYSIA